MSKEEYSGPAENDFYADDSADTYETFDDMEDNEFEETEMQGGTSHDDMEDYDDEGNLIESDEDEEEAPKKAAPSKKDKKEAEKKARGQKGDDMEALDLDDEQIRNIDDEEEEPKDKKDKEEEEEEEKVEEKTEEEKKEEAKPKGKPVYVKIGDETFAMPSDALIPTTVDGKTENVSLQELKNHYAGKVAWDKKFNELNVKERTITKTNQELEEKVSKFTGVKSQIEEIIKDAEKNPKDSFRIFLDAIGVDSYDLEERMFKADLTELANVLAMEPAERKAYFLEKKNSHLTNQMEKRKIKESAEQKTNLYRQQTDNLRKSSNVSEAQYVDAYEELISFGHKDEELTEKEIVEWAATKPHRQEVHSLLEPYADQFSSQDAYGELSWKLVKILQSGTESADTIKKHLKDVYGHPTEVKELSKKLNPVGRKKAAPPQKPTPKKQSSYESFDDIDED